MRQPWLEDLGRAAGILLLCAGSLLGQAQVGESFGVSLNPAQKSASQFHGGFYHLFRSDALNARSFFDTRVEPYQHHDLRVALTGPFGLPDLRHRQPPKWFFSLGLAGNNEWRREHRRATVPTAAERVGDFRNSPSCTEAFRQQFPDCQVPPETRSRYGQQLLAPYPLPNTEGGTFNLVRQASRQTAVWQQTGGLEYAPPGRLKAGLRLSREAFAQRLPFQGSAMGTAPVERRRSNQNARLQLTATSNPTSVKTLSIAGTSSYQLDRSLAARLAGSSVGPGALGNSSASLPAVSIEGFAGYSDSGLPGFSRSDFVVRYGSARTRGKHELKLGVAWMRGLRRQQISSLPAVAVTFSSHSPNSTGNPLADVLLGRFASHQDGQAPWVGLLSHQWQLEMADSWKLRPQFNLDYGLMYVLMPAEHSTRGRLANFLPWLFDPARARPVSFDGTLAEDMDDPLNGIVYEGAGAPRGLYSARYRDFAPHAGLAWQPFPKRKFTVRAGGKVSFDRPLLDPAMGNNPPMASRKRLAGQLDNAWSGTTERRRPPPLVALHPDFRNPTVYSGNARVEQDLGGNKLAIGYRFSLGRHLVRQRNLNQLPPGTLLGTEGVHPDALRPFPGYGTIAWREAAGNSSHHALELSAISRKPFAGLTYDFRYSFSKVLTDSTRDKEFPQDHFNLRNDRGPAAFDRRHFLVVQFLYRPPFPREMPTWAGRLLGNWEIAGICTFATGPPFDIAQLGDRARMGSGTQRPDALASPYLPRDQRSLHRYFRIEVFRSPALGRLGNAGRYLVFGPGMNNVNLALTRSVELSKSWKGQFRAEFTNAFNHPSFNSVGVTFDPATYLLPSSSFGRVTGAGPGRSVQLVFKILF